MTENRENEILRESVDRLSNEQIVDSIFISSYKAFTQETFNFYDFNKIIFVQLIAMVNDGLVSEERIIEIEEGVKERLNDFMCDMVRDLVREGSSKNEN